MARLIDADALRKNFEDLEIVRHEWMTPSRGEIQGLDVAICVLADAPTVDAVPVVLCRECRWWDEIENSTIGYCHACKHGYCSSHWEISIRRTYKGDFFCADGERKDGADK